MITTANLPSRVHLTITATGFFFYRSAIYRPDFGGFYGDLPARTEFYRLLQSFTGFYRVLREKKRERKKG